MKVWLVLVRFSDDQGHTTQQALVEQGEQPIDALDATLERSARLFGTGWEPQDAEVYELADGYRQEWHRIERTPSHRRMS